MPPPGLACARNGQAANSRTLSGIRGQQMKRTDRIFATLVLGDALGLTLGFVAPLGVAAAR